MILVLGSSADRVYPQLISHLRESGHRFTVVDEDHPEAYSIRCEAVDGRTVYRVEGGGCDGLRPVGSIFVRHAVARTTNQRHLRDLGLLQAKLNQVLLSTSCPVINPPSNASSNYSKPYQLGLLAEAGLDVPYSLVTNIPEEAQAFLEECKGQVIFKGVSNVPTLAQLLTAEKLPRLDFLPNSPTLFQEYVAGVDYRVHIVGDEAFVTRLVARNEDYRRSSLLNNESILVEAARLPSPLIAKCIGLTRRLGLVVSGIDFKEDSRGRIVALELNPYPQFTFYEGRSGQPITKAVVDYLVQNRTAVTNLFA
jgi:glutathione synthase/RimK-type ligase-like ATP-grasp enzyme